MRKKRCTPSMPLVSQGLLCSTGPRNISYMRKVSAPNLSTSIIRVHRIEFAFTHFLHFHAADIFPIFQNKMGISKIGFPFSKCIHIQFHPINNIYIHMNFVHFVLIRQSRRNIFICSLNSNKQTGCCPVSFPGSPVFYTAHQSQYTQDRIIFLSTSGCIINVLLHVRYHQYKYPPGSSNHMLCGCRKFRYCADPCSAESTRKNLHNRAWYSFPDDCAVHSGILANGPSPSGPGPYFSTCGNSSGNSFSSNG